eukprot:TRINITY_DN48_c0_g3_i5.p1 TRINITY_DN48_c0_g3~~TRINITY_DN48_c0_g3_i5.p1  ORF type:complete len:192 (-),score=59.18 TRINITY_DN48_c0_g3_i5:115-690(-)
MGELLFVSRLLIVIRRRAAAAAAARAALLHTDDKRIEELDAEAARLLERRERDRRARRARARRRRRARLDVALGRREAEREEAFALAGRALGIVVVVKDVAGRAVAERDRHSVVARRQRHLDVKRRLALLRKVRVGVGVGVGVRHGHVVQANLHFGAARAALVPYSALIPCLLYTSPSPRDMRRSRMPSSA